MIAASLERQAAALYLEPDRAAQRLAPNVGHGRDELVDLNKLVIERLAS